MTKLVFKLEADIETNQVYYLDGKRMDDFFDLQSLKLNNIKKIKVLNFQDAQEKYGVNRKVVEITTKK